MARLRFSVSELRQGLTQVSTRFPFAILYALCAFFAIVQIIEYQDEIYLNQLLVSLLAMPLTVAVTLLAESFNWSKLIKLIGQVILLALMVLYFILLPEDFDSAPYVHLYRYIGLLFAAHLLVSVSVIGYRNHHLLFWNFNQFIFFRWLLASIFSMVLYAGIAGALLAIHFLFNVDIREELYGHLFALIASVFHPIYFLAGMPRMQDQQDDAEIHYPKQLNIFSIYILLPIVLIYLIILYAYGAKIIITLNWPIGWVAWLVLGFSVSGIFAYLLIYPLKDSDKNTLARLYYRFYFLLLIPILLLLYVAIFKRISMYSFTEDRYIILIAALWLSILCVHNFIRRSNLIFIPVSLFFVTMISLLGPWSMFSVSRQMQYERFIEILDKNKVRNADGQIAQPDTTLQTRMSLDDRFEITSISKYLCDMHGIEVFEELFTQSLDSIKDQSRWNQRDYVLDQIGIEAQHNRSKEYNPETYFSFNCDNVVFDVKYYDLFIADNLTILDNMDSRSKLICTYQGESDTIEITSWVKNKLGGEYNSSFPEEDMTFYITNKKMEKKIVINAISGNYEPASKSNQINIYNVQAYIFIKKLD
ncbi:MAG: DUF4153 domain-containing protein [Bacteroidota bacterium]